MNVNRVFPVIVFCLRTCLEDRSALSAKDGLAYAAALTASQPSDEQCSPSRIASESVARDLSLSGTKSGRIDGAIRLKLAWAEYGRRFRWGGLPENPYSRIGASGFDCSNIIRVRSKQMPKMLLAKYDDMVKAVASDRADEPLTISVLPWRSRRGWTIPNAHRPKSPDDNIAICAISVANDISRRFLPAECFRELTSYPFGIRMRGRSNPEDFTMVQNQESVQQSK